MAEESMGIDVGVPDVGDLVEYEGRRYRVDGWMRARVPRKPVEETLRDATDPTSLSGLYEDMLYESQQDVHGKKLRWCYREEAQYLSLVGVAGAVAPVDECKVVGRVNWSPEHIEEARKGALLMAERGEVLY